jgi:hypothetical protein
MLYRGILIAGNELDGYDVRFKYGSYTHFNTVDMAKVYIDFMWKRTGDIRTEIVTKPATPGCKKGHRQ